MRNFEIYKFIFILPFSIILISCNEKTKNNSNTKASFVQNNKLKKGDFSSYWRVLGKSLKENDSNSLNELIDSKIIIYGREDSDPIITVGGWDRIIKVRELYLNGGFYDYLNDSDISYIDFFSKDISLRKRYENGPNSLEIEDFSFEKSNSGVWKLKTISSNTKIID